ncbi:hypothetical protein GR925_25845 [Streptomyces sp. HUCO-GS316]|uniref:hypothetical protein n=1 Tax=Streptomyces sp. HUCO-GS316 TaxID=2692198 RepID=UPI001371B822|nr:hypothetical protein [Streptomyces sp. HUCO-GS316]MXM66760.1 hypothetical protein [Streptomyces sp. HUCO-GS316]
MNRGQDVIHACPLPGRSYTDCCLRTTTEVPRSDLFSHDPERVTCTTRTLAEIPAEQDGGESPFGWRDLPQ